MGSLLLLKQCTEQWSLCRKALKACKNSLGHIATRCFGGAHADPEKMFKKLKTEIKKNITKLREIDTKELLDKRIEKFCAMGAYKK